MRLRWLCYFAEQQYFEVEKRLAQSQERLVNETQECQTLREELKKLRKCNCVTPLSVGQDIHPPAQCCGNCFRFYTGAENLPSAAFVEMWFGGVFKSAFFNGIFCSHGKKAPFWVVTVQWAVYWSSQKVLLLWALPWSASVPLVHPGGGLAFFSLFW